MLYQCHTKGSLEAEYIKTGELRTNLFSKVREVKVPLRSGTGVSIADGVGSPLGRILSQFEWRGDRLPTQGPFNG